MSLNGNDIVEATLLEPTDEQLRTPATPEEDATLSGEQLGLPEAPEAAASPQDCLETPKPDEAIKQINALSAHAPSSPVEVYEYAN